MEQPTNRFAVSHPEHESGCVVVLAQGDKPVFMSEHVATKLVEMLNGDENFQFVLDEPDFTPSAIPGFEFKGYGTVTP